MEIGETKMDFENTQDEDLIPGIKCKCGRQVCKDEVFHKGDVINKCESCIYCNKFFKK